MTSIPMPFASIAHCLRWRAENQADSLAYTFLADGEREEEAITYRELEDRAQAMAAHLRSIGAERVLIMLPAGIEVLVALFGCFYSGVVAVPVPPPEPGRLHRTLDRLRSVIADSKASGLITNSELKQAFTEVCGKEEGFAHLRWIVRADVPAVSKKIDFSHAPDSLALMQYTSGSTSTPKGVMVTHDNVIHQLEFCRVRLQYGPEGKGVGASWMPYYHDYGLFESYLLPLWSGMPTYLMAPSAFIEKPLRWIKAISKYRVTHANSPSFGYNHCVRRFRADECQGLDLSCWRLAGIGAEPVRPELLAQFIATFAPYGMSAKSFIAAYGMAEASLGISMNPAGQPIRVLVLDAAELENGRAVITRSYDMTTFKPSDMPDTARKERVFSTCGIPIGDYRVAIVNPDNGERAPDHTIGEIWAAGKSVTAGYWNHPVETKETFQAHITGTDDGPYMRTGDLGFIHEGEVVVTGRRKDLIILRGQNHYPQDIELSAERSHPLLQPGDGAAFSVEHAGEERVVVVQGIQRNAVNTQLDTEAIFQSIRQSITTNHGIDVWAIVLTQPYTVPKTSSGKIARRLCKQRFISGKLDVIARWDRPAQTETDLPAQVGTIEKAEPQAMLEWLGQWLQNRGHTSLPTVDPDAPIHALGLDSIALVELAADLENRFALARSQALPSVMTATTFGSLCRELTGTAKAEPALDLDREAQLPQDIRIEGPRRAERMESVLITGATGFLGAFLVDEIMRNTRCRVICLVRDKTQSPALSRLQATLRNYGLWNNSYAQRLEVIVGDLSQKHFGLNSSAWMELAKKVDIIYHAGCTVNFVLSYRALKPVNVFGTEQVLRLAAAGGGIPVCYVSSFGFLGQATAHPERLVKDMAGLDDKVFDETWRHYKMADVGYVQAKRVADQWVQEAGERGIPVTTFRPAYISGHSRTGAQNPADYINRLITGCMELGAAPDQKLILNISPVDYVARVIVHLGQKSETRGHGFDILNPKPLPWNDLISALNSLGCPVKLLAPAAWKKELESKVLSSTHPLFGLLPLFASRPEERLLLGYPIHHRGPALMAQLTTDSALHGSGIACPAVNDELVGTYLKSLQRRSKNVA